MQTRKRSFCEVWVAVKGLIESPPKYEPLMQDCWFESSVTFTVDNSTFINKHSLIYCKGLLIHKRSVGTKQINLMLNVDKKDLARPNHKKLWNPFHLNALERRVVKMFRSSKKIKMHFNSLFSNYFFFTLNTLILSFTYEITLCKTLD